MGKNDMWCGFDFKIGSLSFRVVWMVMGWFGFFLNQGWSYNHPVEVQLFFVFI
jgi:hypothetical protein